MLFILSRHSSLNIFNKITNLKQSLYRAALGLYRFKPSVRSINFIAMGETRTAYFHLLDGSDKFSVSFHYYNELVNVNRQFNFERRTTETVQAFLSRVTTNLEKVVGNKLKKKLKKCDNNEVDLKVSVELLLNDSKVPDSAICHDVFFSNANPSTVALTLKLIGINYTVAINSPWVDSISLPSIIMAEFPVYPIVVSKFVEKSVSEFVWMKSPDKNATKSHMETKKESLQAGQWQVIGKGFVYVPTTEDIGSYLKVKCTPKNTTSSGPCFECESTSIIEAGPGYFSCPFAHRHSHSKISDKSFRVISYNILADVYASTETALTELFDYCPPNFLDIGYRKPLLLKEISGYDGDLVCLQEVDTKVFEEDLVPVLEKQHLVGIHAKKTNVSEGVATFYSTSKFKLVEAHEVVLSQELTNKTYCSHILQSVEKNEKLKQSVVERGSVALALVLENLETRELLVVGNTHLYFHPDADHIRLLQGGILIAFLSNIVENIKFKDPTRGVSLVCCGDFNSVPECGIYKLMTTKHVPADFIDWKSRPEEEVQGLSLSQPYNIDSACGTPEYTNFTVKFKGCLDYIYYQTDRLKVDAVVPLPSDEEVKKNDAIPSKVFPSDHIALVADLSWKEDIC